MEVPENSIELQKIRVGAFYIDRKMSMLQYYRNTDELGSSLTGVAIALAS